jgi:hypothetical protein
MRRLGWLLVLSLILSWPGASARAQAALSLAQLEIELWPEYDRPAMLVIYRGALATDAPLPSAVQFEIPRRAGQPTAVAYRDPGGQLINLKYSVNPSTSSEKALLSFEAPTAHFQFEYYDPEFDVSPVNRRYIFTASTPYAIQSLQLKVQLPVGASDLTTRPPLAQQLQDSRGVIYYVGERDHLAPGDPITLDLAYTKNDDVLTVEQTAEENETALDPLLIGVVVMGLAGSLVVGWGVWSRLRAAPAARPAKATRPPRPAAQVKSTPAQAAVYCHHCGQRAQPADVFCRQCGEKLREKR